MGTEIFVLKVSKNGSILYEDFELRNEVTVTFPAAVLKSFEFRAPATPLKSNKQGAAQPLLYMYKRFM